MGRWFSFSFHIWSAIPDFSIAPRSSVKVPEFDKHLKKAEDISAETSGNNNKDEDDSPKTLNDKNICKVYVKMGFGIK